MQCLIELCFLFPGWVDSILKHFTHARIIRLSCSIVNGERAHHSPSRPRR
jgi:hypothetical protein